VNYVRLWMPSWAFGIEWLRRDGETVVSSLGDYRDRLDRAWQLDHVLEAAQAHGIYVMLTLQNHGPFSLEANSQWEDEPPGCRCRASWEAWPCASSAPGLSESQSDAQPRASASSSGSSRTLMSRAAGFEARRALPSPACRRSAPATPAARRRVAAGRLSSWP
jgi:hypothetical protein